VLLKSSASDRSLPLCCFWSVFYPVPTKMAQWSCQNHCHAGIYPDFRPGSLALMPTPNLGRCISAFPMHDPCDRKLFTGYSLEPMFVATRSLNEGWRKLPSVKTGATTMTGLMAPVPGRWKIAVGTVDSRPCQTYAPVHGPMATVSSICSSTKMETVCKKREDTSVALLYASAHGNTATLAQAIAWRHVLASACRAN